MKIQENRRLKKLLKKLNQRMGRYFPGDKVWLTVRSVDKGHYEVAIHSIGVGGKIDSKGTDRKLIGAYFKAKRNFFREKNDRKDMLVSRRRQQRSRRTLSAS